MDRLRDADTTLVVPNPFDIPPPGSIHDKPGFFIDCDLEAGFLGTPLRAYWANMITECIRNAILKAGMVPEYTDWTQLGVAIQKIAEKLIEDALDEFEFVQEGGNVSGTIKNRKFTLNAPALPATLTRIGGNVTGSISIANGTFALDAPAGPDLPDVLVQDGGNVTGTISIADGKFTLNAEAGDGGGEPPPPLEIANGILVGSPEGRITAIPQSNWDGINRDAKISNGTWVSESFPDIGFYAADRTGAGAVGFCAETAGAPSDAKLFFEGRYYPSLEQAYKVTTAGNAFADGAFSGGGADYAEWFETTDGQSLSPGVSVCLEDGKVRAATPEDARVDIIGITRPATAAGVIGNSAELGWQGRFLRDAFGAPRLTEDGGYVLNPAYDPSRPYIPRSLRPEWVLVGLVGQIPLLADQPRGDRWRVMRPVSETVTLVYIR